MLAAAFALIPRSTRSRSSTQAWLGDRARRCACRLRRLAIALLALAREVGHAPPPARHAGRPRDRGRGSGRSARAPESLAHASGRNGADFGLAVFTSEGCRSCQTLAPAIENVAKDPRVTVASFDEVAEADLWRELEIPGSPFALALDRRGHGARQGDVQQPRAARERAGNGGSGGGPGRLPIGA